jgi:prepilin-type N-terminal cleavage/methylation domain-containing protein/prepilin-type processing-associated H-X9-DG protein
MKRGTRAFTLIEILVVVAIIALLIAILLPSLSRAKAMARMVQCQSNLHQLATAFCMYTGENKGRLPGTTFDPYADWLGRRNKPPLTGWGSGREPEDGVIWKHMGRQKMAYICPDDDRKTEDPSYAANQLRAFSYTCNMLVSGARTETLTGAHTPLSSFNSPNHTGRGSGPPMKAFDGVPMLVEEDYDRTLVWNAEGGWGNTDGITERHLKMGGRGYGNLGFTDGHVGKVQLRPGTPGVSDFFCVNSLCIRKVGGKWVNGQALNSADAYNKGIYGYMDHAESASMYGILH